MASTLTKLEVMRSLTADLEAEQDDLHSVLADIDEADWSRATPAEGWTIQDQVAHLSHFDFITRVAISDPDRFTTIRDAIPNLQTYVDHVGPANLSRSGDDMRAWWSREAAMLRKAALASDPSVRVPWFGPAMSLPSKLTARIMETWAHGQDILDALVLSRPPSPRLPHVARIGVLALPNSYAARGMEVPDTPVRVELDAPDGSVWRTGPEDAHETVTGPMEDFCLVVTQRRHVDDTAIRTKGHTATQWMSLAQAFAGPAGPGRRAGQFATTTTQNANGVSS